MNSNNVPEINTEIQAVFAQAIAELDLTDINFDEEGSLEEAIHRAKTKAIAAWWAHQLSKKNLPTVSDLLFGLAEWTKTDSRYSEAKSHLFEAADAALGVELASKP